MSDKSSWVVGAAAFAVATVACLSTVAALTPNAQSQLYTAQTVRAPVMSGLAPRALQTGANPMQVPRQPTYLRESAGYDYELQVCVCKSLLRSLVCGEPVSK